MPSYDIIAGTFNDGHQDTLRNVTLAPKLFELDHLGEYSALAHHVATLLQSDVPKDCTMYDMLGDAAQGCCTIETRDDLLDSEAVPGTIKLLFYFSGDCFYADSRAPECDAGTCHCEGDIMMVTLEPV